MPEIRIMIVSDIHANFQALQAVIGTAVRLKINHLVSLGDSFGYGAEPKECFDLLRSSKAICLRGNHEEVLLGNAYLQDRMLLATTSLEYAKKQMAADLSEIEKWPQKAIIRSWDCSFAHSSFVVDWRYVRGQTQVLEELAKLKTNIGFVGHTHKPFVYCNGQYFDKALLSQTFRFEISANNKFFANPGSVGQPRDKDPRSSFGILCLNQELHRGIFKIFRVDYDIVQAVEKIIVANLSEFLALRLIKGI